MSIVEPSLTRSDELRAELREVCLKECGGAVTSIRQAMQAIAKNPAGKRNKRAVNSHCAGIDLS